MIYLLIAITIIALMLSLLSIRREAVIRPVRKPSESTTIESFIFSFIIYFILIAALAWLLDSIINSQVLLP